MGIREKAQLPDVFLLAHVQLVASSRLGRPSLNQNNTTLRHLLWKVWI